MAALELRKLIKQFH